MNYRCLHICVLLVVANLCLGQFSGTDPYVEKFSIRNGLPSLEVYDLSIDSLGNLWASTDRGISKYNGYNFETFTTSEGIYHNTNFEINEGPNGELWFVSYDGGLFYVDNNGFGELELLTELKSFSKGRWVSRMLFDDSKIVITTIKYNQQYIVLDLNEKDFKILSVKDSNQKHHIQLSDELFEIRYGTNQIYCHTDHGFDRFNFTFQNGERYAVFGSKLYQIKKGKIELVKEMEQYSIDYVYTEDENNIWFGTDKGLLHFEEEDLHSEPDRFFRHLSITSIKKDLDHNYWVSSLEDGIYLIPSFAINSISIESSLQRPEKWIFFGESADDMMIGTSNKRLFRMKVDDTDSKCYPRFQPIKNDIIFDNYSSFYLPAQFEYLDALNDRLARSFFPVTLDEKNLEIWVDIGYKIRMDDLIYYSTSNEENKLNKKITTIRPAEGEGYWIGTTNGMFKVNEDFKYVIHQIELKEKLQTRISDIHVLSDKELLISTIANGIIYCGENFDLEINKSLGLSSDLVNKVEVQNDTLLWAATNNGLNKIMLKRDNDDIPIVERIEIYSTFDGLSSNYINDVRFRYGKLWLALDNAINFFSPEELERDISIPTMLIDKINEVGSQTLVPDNHKFDYNTNGVEIHYTGISNNKPSNEPFYRYSLLKNNAIHHDWVYTNDRTAMYTDLEPGHYTFRVKSRNRNNEWSKSSFFNFKIGKHYSQTIWFKMLLLLFLIFIALAIINYYQKRKRQRQILAEATMQIKVAELNSLRNQMNPHFIFNSLNSIQNFIFNKDRELALHYLSKFSKLIRNTLEFSKLEYVLLESEIAFLKNYLELEKMRHDNFQYEIKIESSVDPESIKVPPLIIQPVIENSIKHGFKDIDHEGFLQIEIKQRSNVKDTLIIEIKDNGNGIDHSAKTYKHTTKKSHGLDIIKMRIKLLNIENEDGGANFEIRNLPNSQGVHCIFTLPSIDSEYD
ncbi:MAG: histidine kinase [Bacteroidota bacterium]